MSKNIRDQAERKIEIMNLATLLFKEKGFEQTAVSDIVKAAGIAQGTFYLYFKSKEDVFVAVLENINDKVVQKLVEIQHKNNMNSIEKINLIINLDFNLNREHDDLFIQLHLKGNESIHHKYIIHIINRLKPIYSAVIEQGVQEGLFNTQFPEQTAEYMLTAMKFMFDPAIFPVSNECLKKKIVAVQDISERILGAPKDSLNSHGIIF